MISTDALLQQSDIETTLLILICRVYLGTETQETILSFLEQYKATLEYKKFYQLAKRNRIRPVVYSILSAMPVDKRLLKRLEEDCRNSTLSIFKNLKETERLIDLLEAKNIHVIPYRGMLFSKIYYGEWTMRESSDIDFLIQEKDIPGIITFIAGEHYHSAIPADDYRNKYLYTSDLSVDVNNDTEQQRNIHLEFHYNISPACYGVDAGYQQLAKDTILFQLNDRCIPVLSSTSNAKMLLAHHGLHDIWVSLKYYLDMAVLSKTPDIDWKETETFCRKNGYYKLSAAGLYNMELLMGISNPFRAGNKERTLAGKLLKLSLFSDKYHGKKRYKLYLRIKGRDNLLWQCTTIKGLLAIILKPSAEDFKWKYFPPYLFGLYYICKPIRLFTKYIIQPLTGKEPEIKFR